MPRTKIPTHIVIDVLTESGYRCAVPTCRNILAIDMHHIIEVQEGGPNDQSNLIALCPTCHALYTRGTITRESINTWKTMIISLNHAFDKESINNLLFLYRTQNDFEEKISKIDFDLNTFSVEEAIKYLKQLNTNDPNVIRNLKILLVSGDGVLKFSHLIASGLAEYTLAFAQHGSYLYAVSLTSKGERIVEAWFSGNREAVKNALNDLPNE